MRVAAVTMSYNEIVNLPIWLKYYGREFGEESLFVLDHGSEPSVRTEIGAANFLRLPRDHHDNVTRVAFISDLCSALLTYFDCVIYTDTDEIIVPDPRIYPSFVDFLSASSDPVLAPAGINLVHDFASEPDLAPGAPVLGQRQYGYFRSSMCKPVIIRRPVRWDIGFHAADHDYTVDHRCYLVHTRYMDRRSALDRLAVTRTMRWSEDEWRINPSHYQRLEDEAFMAQFADRRVEMIHAGYIDPFDPDTFVAEVNGTRYAADGFFRHSMEIGSTPFILPEWLRQAF